MNFLGGFVEAFAYPGIRDDVIIAGIHRTVLTDWRMNGDIHVLMDFHGFAGLARGPFDQIITLAMGVQPFFDRVSLALQEIIVVL